MTPLAGKTVLIVGLGQTGQAVAARARAFGMHVIGTRARPAPMENLDEVHAAADLPGLWERADLVVVSVPLLDSTRGLVDEGAFTAMKDSAILIDVSRGGVVDTDAFVEAMRRGAIAGAARDVFETEPLPPDSPVWELENVIVSPHCSAVYDGWNMAAFEMFMDNLERWQRGAPLRNVVDPQRGY
jgi:phosphoglycerate dehydrogenase-like enzyme